jgi:hypothetical protein
MLEGGSKWWMFGVSRGCERVKEGGRGGYGQSR